MLLEAYEMTGLLRLTVV